MHRECRQRFPRHRLQTKRLVSHPRMLRDMRDTHMPWCMSGSLTGGGRENVPGILGACATHNFTHLERGPCLNLLRNPNSRSDTIFHMIISVLLNNPLDRKISGKYVFPCRQHFTCRYQVMYRRIDKSVEVLWRSYLCLHIQSSAVKPQSNITRYFVQHGVDSSRI